MAPTTVHLIRHAEGYHNLGPFGNYDILDPSLTLQGYAQCHALRSSFPYHDQVSLIVSSPLKRTLQTSLSVFSDTISERGVKVLALPELQETSEMPCDTGSPLPVLLEDFKKEREDGIIDFGLVKEGWEVKTGTNDPDAEALEERARMVRLWLSLRAEDVLAVVTHGAFLHYLTQDWEGSVAGAGTGWKNAEFRSYNLTPDRRLIETKESLSRRHRHAEGDGQQQAEWKHAAEKDWDQHGYIHLDQPEDVEGQENINRQVVVQA